MKLYEPATVGVPDKIELMVEELSDRPGGRDPDDTLNENGEARRSTSSCGPVRDIPLLYETPTVPPDRVFG